MSEKNLSFKRAKNKSILANFPVCNFTFFCNNILSRIKKFKF